MKLWGVQRRNQKKKKQRKMFYTENGVDDRDKKLRSSKV